MCLKYFFFFFLLIIKLLKRLVATTPFYLKLLPSYQISLFIVFITIERWELKHLRDTTDCQGPSSGSLKIILKTPSKLF